VLTGALLGLGAAMAAAGWRTRVMRRSERDVATRLPVAADGIVVGAEAISLPADTGRAVLVLHGFGDTPQTVTRLADHLHALGWTVRVPLLPGHGRSLSAFAASGADAWLACARTELAALRRAHEVTALVGVSMGGALATILADGDAELPALALIAPYVSMPTRMRWLVRFHHVWGAVVPYLQARSERSIHDPAERAKSLAYGVVTPRLVAELSRIVRLARRAAAGVRAPTLVVQSREDNRIPPAAAERAFALYGAAERRLVWTTGNGHVITVDYGREQVFELVSGWLEQHVGVVSGEG
jgi:carboxylesterase